MRIPFTALQPTFIKLTARGHQRGVTRAEADGVLFLCPACFEQNKGPVGTHTIRVLFAGVPRAAGESASPARWRSDGASLDTLSLHPSIHQLDAELDGKGVPTGAKVSHWHGWVTNGVVTSA